MGNPTAIFHAGEWWCKRKDYDALVDRIAELEAGADSPELIDETKVIGWLNKQCTDDTAFGRTARELRGFMFYLMSLNAKQQDRIADLEAEREWHDLRKDPEDLPERWPVLIMSCNRFTPAHINKYLIAKGMEEDLSKTLAWLRNPDWLSAVHEYPLWQYITPPQGEGL